MTNKFSENVAMGAFIAHADITTVRTSDIYLSAANANRILGVGFGGGAALASGKKVTVQLMQAQDAAGTAAKVLGTAVTGAALARGVTQEANVADLDVAGGFTFVGVRVSSDNGSTYAGGACVMLLSNRYSQ